MAFLAFDMMAVIGRHANPQQKKTRRRTTAKKTIASFSLIRWSIQEVRRIAIRPARERIQLAQIIAGPLWHLPGDRSACALKAKRQL
jgi:hypothetical protein